MFTHSIAGINITPIMNKIVNGHMAAPRVDTGLKVDFNVFKKDPLELGKVIKYRKDWKKAMKKAFPGGTKQLNVTPPFVTRFTF